MATKERDFNKEAASWDEDPARLKLAADVAKAISKQIDLTSAMDVLDFGCGTGLLSLQLHAKVNSITGVDSSSGMLEVFKAKIASQHLANVKIRHVYADNLDALDGSYHLIVSSMTLHHVRETGPLLDQFYRLIAASGYLCLADLDLENGQFHGNNEGVFHFGFDRSALRRTLTDSGFTDIRDTAAAEIRKPDATGTVRAFTVFIMTGRKQP
jgi:ubiquinone/menaquinone biosynthesis C-methylase UbiE